MPTVRIPTPLRRVTGGAATVEAVGSTVAELLAGLERTHPGLVGRLVDDQGDLHRFVNVFVGDEDVRDRAGLATPVAPGDTVSIVPAVAGG